MAKGMKRPYASNATTRRHRIQSNPIHTEPLQVPLARVGQRVNYGPDIFSAPLDAIRSKSSNAHLTSLTQSVHRTSSELVNHTPENPHAQFGIATRIASASPHNPPATPATEQDGRNR